METAKILRHAFEIGFDTITIIAEKENFSIIGLDESSSIAAQVTFELSEFDYSFDHPAIFPVTTKEILGLTWVTPHQNISLPLPLLRSLLETL